MRETGDYKPSQEEMEHVQAVLQLLNVMADDKRFEIKQNEKIGEGDVKTMADWLTKRLNDSEEKGRNEGENKMGKLMMILFNLGKTEDAAKAASDSEYRQQLYHEFQIAGRDMKTMADWLTKRLDDSEEKGRNEGENRMGKLIKILLKQGRTDDLSKAADDPKYREELFCEFQILGIGLSSFCFRISTVGSDSIGVVV